MSAVGDRSDERLKDDTAAKERRRQARVSGRGRRGLPGRYAALAVGSALLLVASVIGVPAAPFQGRPLVGVATALFCGLGLVILILAALPRPPRFIAGLARRYARWGWLRLAALALTVALAAGTTLTFAGGARFALGLSPAQSYLTDIIAFGQTNARLTLAGRNPYTSDGAFWTSLRQFPAAMVTPFRRGRFVGDPDFPATARLYQAERLDAAQPDQPHPEFDTATLHSYPALSFLVYVPLLALGVTNVLWLQVVVYWALYAWLIWLAPLGWRGWSALVAGTALITVGGSLFLSNDLFCIALLLAAWRYRRRLWLSAMLLGLACAFKQYAWFFAPLLLAEAVALRGWDDAARRGAVALAAFLAPNLPFIVASPRAWLASLWLPMSGAMFQQGLGLIALSMDHALPYLPPRLYSVLEVVTLLGLTLLVWRRAHALGDAVPLLALAPMYFAGRVFPSYFAFAPWLALYAVNELERRAQWRARAFSPDRADQAGPADPADPADPVDLVDRRRVGLAGAGGRGD